MLFRVRVIFLSLISTTLGSVYYPNIELLGGDGFVINPYGKDLDSSESDVQQFYFYNINDRSSVRGRFGGLESRVNLTAPETDSRLRDPLLQSVIKVEKTANVTAHIFKRTITNSKPTVRVLIHSDAALLTARCAQVFAYRTNTEVISGSCLIWSDDLGNADGSAVCLADIMLPYDWWSSRLIDIYFHLKPSVACTSTSNDIVKSDVARREELAFVGDVVLMFDDTTYSTKEIAEDNNLVLSLPDRPVKAGNQFLVSVKLQPGSKYAAMNIKLIVGDDVTLESIRNWDSQIWSVLWRNEGKHAVNIRATPNVAGQVYKLQDVISCHFEVSSAITSLDTSLQWQISYLNSSSSEAAGNTLVIDTRIEVSPASHISAITAVTKTSEVVSLKRFTGVVNTLPIWIYSVNEIGQIVKINQISKCQSDQPNIISVSTLCDIVYVVGDGGDPGVASIEIHFADQEVSIPLRVWYPDVGMIIKLSDSRLNRIRGWYIPPSDDTDSCRQQYQPGDVQVFTRFYTVYNRKDIYLRGQGKTLIFSDITDIVRYQLSTSDPETIRYDTNTGLLHGFTKGKAYLKVLNYQGRTMVSSLVRASSHQVSVDRIEAKMVTDLTLSVEHDRDLDIYAARFSYETVLTDKHPIGYVELWIHFTDDKSVPLSSFDPSSYNLEIVNETPKILEVIAPYTNHSRYITVNGLSTGTSRIKLSIKSKCSTSKPVIASGYLYLESAVTTKDESYLNDAAYRSPSNQRKPVVQFNQPKGQVDQKSAGKLAPIIQTAYGKQQHGLNSTETGMFVLIGVLGVVATILVSNILVYMYRKKNSQQSGTSNSSPNSEKTSNGWVWLDRSTLEDNEICTTPEPFLDERSFLSNISRQERRTNSTGSSFNRNSTGTYKGSECSIRITSNPFASTLNNTQSSGNSTTTSSESVQPVLDVTGGGYSDTEADSDSELDVSCPNITQEEFDCMKETVA